MNARPAQPLIVLLHGLGATGAVWRAVTAALRARNIADVLAPDLPGHGEAEWIDAYTLDELAVRASRQIPEGRPILVAGHSLGGYVALALASKRFPFAPVAVLSIGAKLTFTASDRQRAEAASARPTRSFASLGEALDAYRRVSGLNAAIAPEEEWLERGVCADERGGYRLAQDPRSFGINVPPFASLIGAATCAVAICRGADDALVSAAECEALGRPFGELPGVGHNAHVQAPGAIADLIAVLSLSTTV
jgi:pimeloyl-ACP methyl ester carboxylesterase